MKSCRKKFNKVDSSLLIDSVIHTYSGVSQSRVDLDGCWMIAKPVGVFDLRVLWLRVKAAYRVLKGTSFAVHYAEDEVKK